LVAAIELVSPGNKDRPETRQAFAAKCVSYLTRGIGLIVVDIVTNRLANLHNDVMALFGRGEPFLMTPPAATYAVAYRPSRQPSGDQIELWPMPFTLGQPLPVLPLALRNAGVVPVDLESVGNYYFSGAPFLVTMRPVMVAVGFSFTVNPAASSPFKITAAARFRLRCSKKLASGLRGSARPPDSGRSSASPDCGRTGRRSCVTFTSSTRRFQSATSRSYALFFGASVRS